jgi:chromosome partitioning protein
VLFIDIDPQTNLTFLCAPVEKWQNFKKKNGTIADVYRRFQEKKPINSPRCIWQDPIQVLGGRERIKGLDLLPCDIDLLGEDLGGGSVGGAFPNVEALKKNAQLFLREHGFLKAVVAEVGERYDYVLIDCPPNLYLMTQNALTASEAYVVTAIPDHLSTIGLSILREKVLRIGKLVESAHAFSGQQPPGKRTVAQLGGIVFVKVRIGGSRVTVAHSSKMREIDLLLGSGVCFKDHTTELIGYSEAAETSVPVWALDTPNARHAAGKREYQSITREFMARF